MFEFAPAERDEYPGRTDLLVGYTVVPDLWKRAHADPPQPTVDHARSGESFWYVKIDGREKPGRFGVCRPGRRRGCIGRALLEAGLGCVIGAGTGIRYSYVDLAIVDLPALLDLICKTLRDGRIGRSTRILAFDDHDEQHPINVHGC